MQSAGFPRLAFHIARKDWVEARRVLVGLTLGLIVPALLVRFVPERSEDFAKGLFAGLLAGAGFGYAHFCFFNERQRGTLDTLLGLPVRVDRLILAKYASLYSMVLFTVNVPALLVPDFRLIYITNTTSITLSTVFMAATVVSDKPWAPQVPIWLLLVFVLPTERILNHYYPGGLQLFAFVTARPLWVASVCLVLAPILVTASVILFDARLKKTAAE